MGSYYACGVAEPPLSPSWERAKPISRAVVNTAAGFAQAPDSLFSCTLGTDCACRTSYGAGHSIQVSLSLRKAT